MEEALTKRACHGGIGLNDWRDLSWTLAEYRSHADWMSCEAGVGLKRSASEVTSVQSGPIEPDAGRSVRWLVQSDGIDRPPEWPHRRTGYLCQWMHLLLVGDTVTLCPRKVPKEVQVFNYQSRLKIQERTSGSCEPSRAPPL